MKELNFEILNELGEKYGESFYLLDSHRFVDNFVELRQAFRNIYPNSQIAYSYKTNYIPKLCRTVNRLGGYAEIVSELEYELARRVGVSPAKIIWNGPCKNYDAVCELLLAGGTVNLDSLSELQSIKRIARENPDAVLHVGLRCNFLINDNVLSRFGFDVGSQDFREALSFTESVQNVHLTGLHCHFAARSLAAWPARVNGMIEVIEKLKLAPESVDFGGGLFGKMGEELKAQFDSPIPTFREYADVAAAKMAGRFPTHGPKLIIEPGNALAGDCMQFAAKVVSIKVIRGKPIATLFGSIYNINPTLSRKNLPVHIFHRKLSDVQTYENLDFGGYTCIESDYLYRGFSGELAVGDYVVFDNVGSYSVVLKPPFILPNFAVIEYDDANDTVELIKRRENFDDLFHTYSFPESKMPEASF